MAGSGDEKQVALQGRGNLTRLVQSARVNVQNCLLKQAFQPSEVRSRDA